MGDGCLAIPASARIRCCKRSNHLSVVARSSPADRTADDDGLCCFLLQANDILYPPGLPVQKSPRMLPAKALFSLSMTVEISGDPLYPCPSVNTHISACHDLPAMRRFETHIRILWAVRTLVRCGSGGACWSGSSSSCTSRVNVNRHAYKSLAYIRIFDALKHHPRLPGWVYYSPYYLVPS